MTLATPIHQLSEPRNATPADAEMDLVQGWRSRLSAIQEEIDQQIYGNGRFDVNHLEDASNLIGKALAALRMHSLQEGE